ncbi:MAG: thioredoxin domain-containing protein [Cellulomonadaceae bacterium]|jgi:protein-disulfide isomerase|nr:thioredoxin domain-containing protein [Cellulomonadaceae bacterium]
MSSGKSPSAPTPLGASQPLTPEQRAIAARAYKLGLEERKAAAAKRAKVRLVILLGVILAALVATGVVMALRPGGDAGGDAGGAGAGGDAVAEAGAGDGQGGEAGAGTGTPPAPETIPEEPPAITITPAEGAPSTATDDGGFLIGPGGAAITTPTEGVPTLAVYLDYMCPHCHTFEDATIDSIKELVDAGEVNFILHPISIMDRASTDQAFSTRAVAAVAWVADQAPAQFLAFHEGIFAQNPTQGTAGLSNEDMGNLARSVGVSDDIAEGISDGTALATFGEWVTAATQMAIANPALASAETGQFQGTPTVTINGVLAGVNWQIPGALAGAVRAAAEAA